MVRAHLATFLAFARDRYESPVPKYVEDELRAYLRCGVFAHGFVHLRCDRCGTDLLVAFSCKGRGVCPSCAGRRMANTAAHLADRVLPAVPVRQWVLSLPFDVRMLAAFRADVLSALSRIFVESVFARTRSAARGGLTASPPQCGAVTFVQRFGSSLNLNVHFHVIVVDGVFRRHDDGHLVFDAAPAPSPGDLTAVCRRTRDRATRWLARRADRLADTSPAALRACAETAAYAKPLKTLPDDAAPEDAPASEAPPPAPAQKAVDLDGFNVEASVRIEAQDDFGRERLCRYGARPPFSLERLRLLPGGRIAYRVKRLRGKRTRTRVMTPLEFLARLAALIPPPRYPLVRYHGVLAPRSPWRPEVVPRRLGLAQPSALSSDSNRSASSNPCSAGPPGRSAAHATALQGARAPRAPSPSAGPGTPPRPRAAPATTDPRDDPHTSPVTPTVNDPVLARHEPHLARTPELTYLDHGVISVRHWTRLRDGALYAATHRLDWATLLRRTFDIDVLRCPSCPGRMRPRAELSDPSAIALVLESLGLAPDSPPIARARDPTELLGDDLPDSAD